MLLVRDETGPPDPQVSNNMYFCEIILLQIFGFQKNSLLAVFNLDQSRPTFGFLMFSGASKEIQGIKWVKKRYLDFVQVNLKKK